MNEIHIRIPPLRERGNDLLLLANQFLHRFAQENNRTIKGFTQEAQQALLEYSWPGNVRELRSKVKRAVVMADDVLVKPEDLDIKRDTMPPPTNLKEAREQLEQRLVCEALERNQGNITQAANELGVSRPTLHDLMKKYTISKQDFTP